LPTENCVYTIFTVVIGIEIIENHEDLSDDIIAKKQRALFSQNKPLIGLV